MRCKYTAVVGDNYSNQESIKSGERESSQRQCADARIWEPYTVVSAPQTANKDDV